MDFIMDLPRSNSFVSILVVMNRLTKMVHFIPCNKSIIVEKTIKLFLDHFFAIMDFLKTTFFIVDLNLHISFGIGSSSH
jgi:hypothetical protein